MHITLSPQRSDDTLALSKAGDTLTINGEAFDFSGVTEGATLPREAVACEWLASDVTLIGGVIHLTLRLPIGPDASEAEAFPVAVDATDGEIALPGGAV